MFDYGKKVFLPGIVLCPDRRFFIIGILWELLRN